MGVYKEGKNWKVQVYYKDWKGNRKRKQKRGFRTKGEAKEWERDFLQQQSQGVDIEFGNFLEIYYKDMDVRLRESTMSMKRYIIELKIRPYFEKKVLSEITVADIRAWQNELLSYKDKNGKGYAPTYLKTINCQLTAIFNYAIRYYNLPGNPCKKAGAIGKSKGEPKDFWMQDEFNEFLKTVEDKPDARLAFLVLYWTGMRIGELLALTYYDVNLEEKTISINKSYQRLKGKDVITQPKTPKSIRVITMPDFLPFIRNYEKGQTVPFYKIIHGTQSDKWHQKIRGKENSTSRFATLPCKYACGYGGSTNHCFDDSVVSSLWISEFVFQLSVFSR